MDDKSFADYPTTIGELRSDRSHQASDWSPREVLLYSLRELDSGRIKPDTLAVIWRERKDDQCRARIVTSAPDSHVLIGVLEFAKKRLMED